MLIPEQHLSEWRRHGYTVVEGLLTAAELQTCHQELSRLVPQWSAYAVAPLLYRTDARGGVFRELPYLGDALNLVGVHPDLLDFVERALGTEDILLTQSIVWAKYGGIDTYEQDLHLDYMVSSLAYPSSADAPEQVSLILYYYEVTEDLGPTYVVSREDVHGEPLTPDVRRREEFPALYARERPVLVPAGSALLFAPRTFHRGSRLTRPGGVRVTHHLAYRRADAPWAGYKVWANFGLAAEMQALLEHASPRQRAVLGFPRPGHTYWNEETLAGNAERYPGLDLAPYREAVRRRREQAGDGAAPHQLPGHDVDARTPAPAENTPREQTGGAPRRAAPPPPPGPFLMLNLGSGSSLLPGFVNVDLAPIPGAVVADLREPWPWADSSVDYVYASHVIEHLPDKIFTMNELWRVLKPGAQALIHVPTTDGPGAWQDPTHVSFWNRRSFLYFEAGSPYREEFADRYGIQAKLRTLWELPTPTADGPQLSLLLRAVKP